MPIVQLKKIRLLTASGDYLLSNGQYLEAASVYGKSSKAFEQVALTFIDQGQRDSSEELFDN